MSDFSRDQWVTKIQSLLAKAERAGSEEEATAFFAKAQDLITKWEIDEAELQSSKTGHQAEWVATKRVVNLSTYTPEADFRAMSQVAKAMGLRAAFERYDKHRGVKPAAHIYGVEEDLARFEMMWASLSLQMLTMMKKTEFGDRNQMRAYRMGFKVGYSERVAERIREQRETTVKADKGPGMGLVLLGKKDAVDKLFRSATQAGRRSNIGLSSAGLSAGRDAANAADLGGKRVGNPSNQKGLKA